MTHTWLGFLSGNEAIKTLDFALKTNDENDCEDLLKQKTKWNNHKYFLKQKLGPQGVNV